MKSKPVVVTDSAPEQRRPLVKPERKYLDEMHKKMRADIKAELIKLFEQNVRMPL